MSLRIFFWLVMLALFWGPGFLLVKVAVQDIPPITLMAGRVGVAAGLLYLILRIQGGTLPRFGPIWRHFALMGLFASALPFGLVSWGQQYIDSALAAMLVGVVPLFTAILAHLSTTDDRLTPVKTAGILLGFSGMAVLLAPTLLSGMQTTTWGLMATVVAAASQSIGLVYGRKYLVGLPPLVGPTAQLTMATLYLLPLSLIVERPYTIATPSAMALGAVLALAIMSTALTYVIFYRVMEQTSATNLSLVTYMVPLVATVLGVVVLHERLAWTAYLGGFLIIIGIMVVNGIVRTTGRWRLARPDAPKEPQITPCA